MNLPVFIDTNVPIYASGRHHALKAPCARILLLVSQRPDAFLSDAEVFQELLHRYLSLGLWPEARKAFDLFALVMRDRVEPVHMQDVHRAGDLADRYHDLSARHLLHLAVMKRAGSTVIVSADKDFDRVEGIRRLDPIDVAVWEEEILRGSPGP